MLPILHLNGYKIANPTFLARIPESELLELFRGYGYRPVLVAGSDPVEMHQLMAATLDEILVDIGLKSEGVLSTKELPASCYGSFSELHLNDEVLVYIIQPETADGHAVLSLKRAAAERQWRQRTAGLRTYTLVALGSSLFIIVGCLVPDTSGTRIASYVVSGVGFLGAGVIVRRSIGKRVHGLTSAACAWTTATASWPNRHRIAGRCVTTLEATATPW